MNNEIWMYLTQKQLNFETPDKKHLIGIDWIQNRFKKIYIDQLSSKNYVGRYKPSRVTYIYAGTGYGIRTAVYHFCRENELGVYYIKMRDKNNVESVKKSLDSLFKDAEVKKKKNFLMYFDDPMWVLRNGQEICDHLIMHMKQLLNNTPIKRRFGIIIKSSSPAKQGNDHINYEFWSLINVLIIPPLPSYDERISLISMACKRFNHPTQEVFEDEILKDLAENTYNAGTGQIITLIQKCFQRMELDMNKTNKIILPDYEEHIQPTLRAAKQTFIGDMWYRELDPLNQPIHEPQIIIFQNTLPHL
jgi:hypothetical protein